jgi:polysaccharide export outer membrane protein
MTESRDDMADAAARNDKARTDPERKDETEQRSSEVHPRRSFPVVMGNSARKRTTAPEARAPAEQVSESLPRTASPPVGPKEPSLETHEEEPREREPAPGEVFAATGPHDVPVMLTPTEFLQRSPVPSGSQLAVLVASQAYQRPGFLFPPREADDAPSLESTVRRALRAARYMRQHRWFLVAMATIGISGGALSLLVLPPKRTAEAEVTVRPEPKSNPVDPSGQVPQTDMPQLFTSIERTFSSPEAIRATLAALGIAHASDAEVRRIARGLKLENVGVHDFVATVSLRSSAPTDLDPFGFLSAHLRVYADREIEKMLKVLVAQVDFLRTQTAGAEAELKRIEAEALAFRQAHARQLADQSTLSPQTRSSLEQRRLELTGEVRRLEGGWAGLQRQIKRGSHLERAKVEYAQSYRNALTTVERQLSEARGKGYADGHPEVKRLLAEKASLEAMMEKQLQSDLSGIEKRSNAADDALLGQADQVQAQLAAARAERDFVAESLQKLNRVSSNEPEIATRLDDLTRQQEQAKRLQGQLFERLRRAELQLELERVSAYSRFEITSPPKEEITGIKHVIAERMFIGMVVGLALAGAILFLGLARRFVAEVSRATPALVLLAWMAAGCAHQPAFVWVQDLPYVAQPTQAALIQPRDTISVEILGQPSLSGEIVLRDDGSYFNPLVGSVPLAGLTLAEAGAALRERMKNVVVDPEVSVSMVKAGPIRVGVMGEVKNPGSYELGRDRRLSAALLAAGWLTEYADDDRIFVIRAAGDHQRIRFRLRDLTASEPHAMQFLLLDGDLVSVE